MPLTREKRIQIDALKGAVHAQNWTTIAVELGKSTFNMELEHYGGRCSWVPRQAQYTTGTAFNYIEG